MFAPVFDDLVHWTKTQRENTNLSTEQESNRDAVITLLCSKRKKLNL